jgi:protein arginine kinase activator
MGDMNEEGDEMLCQECKKRSAVVHMTEIVNEKMTEFHLCQECAQKKEAFSMFAPLSINDILASFLNIEKPSQIAEKKEVGKCKTCGIDYNEFKKFGRLGCGDCYKSFRNQLLPLIKRVQGGTVHSGKVSKRAGSDVRAQKRLDQLKLKLKRAIELEDYEEAAGLRDEIRRSERQIGKN